MDVERPDGEATPPVPFEKAVAAYERAALDAAERAVFESDIAAARNDQERLLDLEREAAEADEYKSHELEAQEKAEEAFDRLMRCEDFTDPTDEPDTTTVIRRVGGRVVSVSHLRPDC